MDNEQIGPKNRTTDRRINRLWWIGRWGLLTGIALAVIGIAFPRQLLCVDTGAHAADFLIVLGGDPSIRAPHAAELFRSRIAPGVIVSGCGDWPAAQSVLEQNGVPKSAIILEPVSQNTRQNAEFTVQLLRAAQAKRAVIVTSWYHSRRALACFHRAAPEIQFDSSPAYYCLKVTEWGDRSTGVRVLEEYLKMAVYAVRYGVLPE